ncbi:MAG: alpha/beta hydrolase [Niabella sp.]
MYRYLFTALSTILFTIVHAQSITGDWTGNLEMQGMKLPLVLHFTQRGDSLVSTMDSPAQGAKGIPVDNTIFTNNQLSFELKNLRISYKGLMVGDSISGTFTQGGFDIPLVLKRKDGEDTAIYNRPQTPKPPFNYTIEDVSFINPTEGNTLAGTLTTPSNKKQFPVVVMITGSGAQDRDETLFGHKPFWVIADHLTQNGIGVLRLDDRGVGGSSKGKGGATSADFATDIDAAVNFLLKKGFKNIGLIGHSEGGMIAPMVADRNKNVKFIISMAGPGIPIEELMLLQVEAVNKAVGSSEATTKGNIDLSKSVYSFIKAYKGADLKADLKTHVLDCLKKNPGMVPHDKIEEIAENATAQPGSEWFAYFIKAEPQLNIQKLKIPVLALNGNKDIQVLSKQNLAGWKASLEKAGNKNFKIVEMDGLNHLFQEAKTGAPAEYGQIEQTISPQVLDLMTKWILTLK